jgi:hypothetical protein
MTALKAAIALGALAAGAWLGAPDEVSVSYDEGHTVEAMDE